MYASACMHTLYLWSLKQLQGSALLADPLLWGAVSDLTEVELQESVVHHLREVLVGLCKEGWGWRRGGGGMGGEDDLNPPSFSDEREIYTL